MEPTANEPASVIPSFVRCAQGAALVEQLVNLIPHPSSLPSSVAPPERRCVLGDPPPNPASVIPSFVRCAAAAAAAVTTDHQGPAPVIPSFVRCARQTRSASRRGRQGARTRHPFLRPLRPDWRKRLITRGKNPHPSSLPSSVAPRYVVGHPSTLSPSRTRHPFLRPLRPVLFPGRSER